MQFEIRVEKVDNTNSIVAVDNTNEVFLLVKNAFAYTLQDARTSTLSGTETDQNKSVGPISTNMRLVRQRVGDLSLYFGITNENLAGINNSSLKQIPISNDT